MTLTIKPKTTLAFKVECCSAEDKIISKPTLVAAIETFVIRAGLLRAIKKPPVVVACLTDDNNEVHKIEGLIKIGNHAFNDIDDTLDYDIFDDLTAKLPPVLHMYDIKVATA